LTLTALVIGYGSIGLRHADILNSMNAVKKVSVLSSQFNLPYETITSLEEITKLNPNYIVIASNTSLHYEQLAFLEENLQGTKILVEKPLFNSFYDLEINNNQAFVGFNLRFHPLLQLIKEKIIDKNLWNIQLFCGSYLPDWRPNRDYRISASAKNETGGGVLLDLSHELDYVQWLAGAINIEHVKSEKISNLEIETDDLLLLSGKSVSGAHVHISLNYFTRKPTRQILIDGEGISMQADMIANTLKVYEDNEPSEFAWRHLERNETYQAMHHAVLEGDFSNICNYDQGLEIMSLIERIRSWPQG
jgi:CMP-N,N'-diacetyllegionaminic acid synthase